MSISGDSLTLNTITNGVPEEMKSIPDVNQRFSAKSQCPFTNKIHHGVITPLVMKMNQFRDWNHPTVHMLLCLGADPAMKIDYYGTRKSALDIFGPISV